MKFTNQYQKWALTTGLMVALGFSFSMHFSPKSGPEYAQLGASHEQQEPVMLAENARLQVTHMSAELPPPPPPLKTEEAAKKEESTKKTEAGTVYLPVERDGEKQIITAKFKNGKTEIIYPECKAIQKSHNCPTGNCTMNTSLIDKDLNSDLTELVNVFSSTYGKCNFAESTATATTTKSSADSETSEEEKHKAVFDKLRAKCDKDKDSRLARLQCNIDGLKQLLSDSKVVYTKSVVVDFFKTHIEEPMKAQLSSYDYTNPYAQHEYLQKMQELSKNIKDMQEEIGSSYSYLRERIANMSVRAIAEKALEVNTYRHTGQIGMENAALTQLQMMNYMLPASNRTGLLSAVSNQLVNPLYANNMFTSVGSLGNNMLSNISRIADMDPYSAQALLTTGLVGLDNWSYQRGGLSSLDVIPRLGGLGLDRSDLYMSDSLVHGRLMRRGSGLFDGDIYDRGGIFGRSYDRGSIFGQHSGSGRRNVRRGNLFSSQSSVFSNNFDSNRLGISTNTLSNLNYRTGVNNDGTFFNSRVGRSSRVPLNQF